MEFTPEEKTLITAILKQITFTAVNPEAGKQIELIQSILKKLGA